MKIWYNYAETYVEELKMLGVTTPMFNLKAIAAKSINLDTYVGKHFGKIEYAVEDNDFIYVGDKKLPIISGDSSLGDASGEIAVKIPSLKGSKSAATSFLNKIFDLKKSGIVTRVFGINVSSAYIISNFSFDDISVSPQQIARFKEILNLNLKRVKTTVWQDLVKNTAHLKALGYTPKDLHNADYSKIVTFNVKSYQYLVKKREMLDGGVLEPQKTAKTSKKTSKNAGKLQNSEKNDLKPLLDKNGEAIIIKSPMLDPDKQLEISKKGVLARQGLYRCDDCRLAEKCLDYQEGAICLKKKEWLQLSNMLKTRDYSTLVEAMSDITANQAERYQRAKTFEEIEGGVAWMEVTSLENSLLGNIEKLVRLLKPTSPLDGLGGSNNTVNILNINANVSDAMGTLNEQLDPNQRQRLAEVIGATIKQHKLRRARDSRVASKTS